MSNTTLFGKKTLQVKYEDGRDGELDIHQLKLKQYQLALPVMEDEIGLVALCSGKPRGVIEALHPDSFEAAYAAVKEVNEKGFFTFADRALERAARNLKSLPPEMLTKVLAQRSLPASPGSPPPAA